MMANLIFTANAPLCADFTRLAFSCLYLSLYRTFCLATIGSPKPERSDMQNKKRS